jgi:anthranilate synthase component 2
MILVIDNYDSFTWNLVHLIEALGPETFVHRNDALSVDAALALGPSAVVLSPGPCTPNEAGICLDLLAAAPATLPILGVCLGHQAIGQAFGGEVVAASAIMHGKLSTIRCIDRGLFAGLPPSIEATRYHSLAVRRATLPSTLQVDAETADGEIMGISHTTRPIFGVQFHPESIASEHGDALMRSFLRAAGLAS